MPSKISAGLLPYRRVNDSLEVLLAHYGGPLWARKDLGAWTVIKGEPSEEENQKMSLREVGAPSLLRRSSHFGYEGREQSSDVLLEVAKREFTEETGITPPSSSPSQGEDRGGVEFIPLGEITQRGGKTVHTWAFQDSIGVDPRFISDSPRSVFEMEWPPRSGQIQQFPEIDRAEWFSLEIAREKINPAQVAFLDRLFDVLK